MNQTVTYTVTVARTDALPLSPSGTVTWLIDGASSGTTLLDASGHASFTRSGGWTAAGTHTIRALYAGATYYAASNSNVIYQTVRSAF